MARSRTGRQGLKVASAILLTALCAPIVLGQASEPTYVLTGATADAKLGAYVASVPDVTGDGIDDLVSGNHRWDGPAGVDCGRVLLFNGATGALLWTVDGDLAGGLMGHNVWGIRDLTGDGKGDVIASAYRYRVNAPNVGKTYLLDGATGAVLWSKTGTNSSDEFGYALTNVPDLDNDGFEDVIVGAWLNDDAFYLAGKAYVYSGKTGALIRTHAGGRIDARFGCSAAGFADLDNDGYGDYVIGSRFGGANQQGEAYLYSGKTGQLLHTFTGEAQWDSFSWSTARVDDTDGDGVEDIYFGASDTNVGPAADVGKGYLYSGKTYQLLHEFFGENAYDKFGRFGAAIPDVNEDGYGDLAIGAHQHWSGGFVRSGATYIYDGKTGALLRKLEGETTQNLFGFAICGMNDLNGDGRGDIVVGAYQYDPNQALTESYGRIYAYTGGLEASATTVSAATGGTVTFSLDGGAANASRQYLLVASAAGSTPGFDLVGRQVPLNVDSIFIASWLSANSALLTNTFGALDANSEATCTFNPTAGLLQSLVGLKLTFAYVLVTPNPDMVSNPVTIDVVP